MKKQWLAVIRDNDLTVARVATGKNKEMKVLFLSEYRSARLTEQEPGEILNQDFASIKHWLDQQRIPYKKLKIAISSLGLITRVITLPQMSNNDLEKLITDHIDQYFTLNVKNYIIDYRILNKYRENEKPMIEVLLAAFPRMRVKNVLALCQYLQFEPMVIDLTADCLARIYANLADKSKALRSTDSQHGSFQGDMAIVSMHGDKIEFVLLENGTFFLYSDMELDIQTISARFQRKMADKEFNSVNAASSSEINKTILAEISTSPKTASSLEIKSSQNLGFKHQEETPFSIEAGLGPVYASDSEYLLDDILLTENGVHFLSSHTHDIELNSSLDARVEEIFNRYAIAKDNITLPEFVLDQSSPEAEEFQSVALSITSRKDYSDVFVLEDLFVPLENLEEELPITLSKQELLKQLESENHLHNQNSVDDKIIMSNNKEILLEEKIDHRNIESYDDIDLNRLSEIEFESFLRKTPKKLDKTIVMASGFEENSTSDTLEPSMTGVGFDYKAKEYCRLEPKEELKNALSPVLSTLSEHLEFFAARHFGQTVHSVYLTGEFCTLPYLAEIFSENLSVQTVVGFPKDWKPQLEGSCKGMAAKWPKYGSLYGLALRED